jgi:hypothetical protein
MMQVYILSSPTDYRLYSFVYIEYLETSDVFVVYIIE